MTGPLEDLVQACTVEVTERGRRRTGFFVAPGKLLTNISYVQYVGDAFSAEWTDDRHLKLQGIDAEESVQVDKQSAVTARHFRRGTVIEVPIDPAQPCVGFDLDDAHDDDPLLIVGTESIVPARFVRFDADIRPYPAVELAIDDEDIGHACIGAPVLNRRTGGVWGMLIDIVDRASGTTGRALPLRELASEVWVLFAANLAYHQSDQRWVSAGGHHHQLETLASLEGLPTTGSESDASGPSTAALRAFVGDCTAMVTDGAHAACGCFIAPGLVLTDLTDLEPTSAELAIESHPGTTSVYVTAVTLTLSVPIRGAGYLADNFRRVSVLEVPRQDHPCVGLDLGLPSDHHPAPDRRPRALPGSAVRIAPSTTEYDDR